jgi:hypothetical protein
MQAVDSIGAAAYPDRNGIALDDNGTPYISYYDAKIGVLKLAYRKGNKWFSEIVDSEFTSDPQWNHLADLLSRTGRWLEICIPRSGYAGLRNQALIQWCFEIILALPERETDCLGEIHWTISDIITLRS